VNKARQRIDRRIPRYGDLIEPTFSALKLLGGSGSNDEILTQIIENMHLLDEIVDIPHKDHESMTELAYQAAWARTYLRSYGVIENVSRSVWAITSNYVKVESVDAKEIVTTIVKRNAARRASGTLDAQQKIDDDETPEDDGVDTPDEVKEWRMRLTEILQHMNPYGFERLTQRVLRACGFTEVKVTKSSGDGGIDGTGKLKINGVFSFNVAFQCKRYKGSVGAPEGVHETLNAPAKSVSSSPITALMSSSAAVISASISSFMRLSSISSLTLASMLGFYIGVPSFCIND